MHHANAIRQHIHQMPQYPSYRSFTTTAEAQQQVQQGPTADKICCCRDNPQQHNLSDLINQLSKHRSSSSVPRCQSVHRSSSCVPRCQTVQCLLVRMFFRPLHITTNRTRELLVILLICTNKAGKSTEHVPLGKQHEGTPAGDILILHKQWQEHVPLGT